MPTSISAFNKEVINHITAIAPKTVLDVGPGMGKYSDLIRSINSSIICDAVESTGDYILEYNLTSKYRNVFQKDIIEFVKTDRLHHYDLCIMGDILEHLFLSEAIDVIDALAYKCKHLIVIWPTNLPQDSEFESHYEMHKSNFTLRDISRFNIQCYKKTFGFYRNRLPVELHYVLIAGHTTANDEILRRFIINEESYVTGITNEDC
jgi:hypothetical protein